MRKIRGPSLAAAGLCLALALSGCGREEAPTPTAEPTVPEAPERSPDAPEVTLVFPASGGGLVGVSVGLELPEDPEERIRGLLLALLEGPEEDDGSLVSPFGPDVGLGDVYLDPRGVAYVDLVSEGRDAPPDSGSRTEMQRVFSVVDTVLLNTEEARSVVLLWNGRQRSSLAGHVDTGQPLGIDRSLLRGEVE